MKVALCSLFFVNSPREKFFIVFKCPSKRNFYIFCCNNINTKKAQFFLHGSGKKYSTSLEKDEFHFQNDIFPVPKVDKTKDNCSDYPEHECQPFREAFGKHIIVGNENHIYLDDFGKLQINPKENKCSNILEVSQKFFIITKPNTYIVSWFGFFSVVCQHDCYRTGFWTRF